MHLHVEVEKNLGKDEEEDQGWNGINNKIKLKKVRNYYTLLFVKGELCRITFIIMEMI